ncbi:MAG: hypothetical protein HY079_11910 [Elusimicrobia bacterium]|nr:hypothetical protein [Elusimicrobiota bacterium]
MKRFIGRLRDLALTFLKYGWPLVLADAALAHWAGEPLAAWRRAVNSAAFGWVLCAPVAPLSLLLDRARRERAMGRLCGLREGDERERVITGEAARTTLLLGLSLQVVLLVLTLVSVRLDYDPTKPKGQGRGLLQVGLSFSTERHLDPFGAAVAPPAPARENTVLDGYVLTPAAFPVLALLILAQLAAFKAFSLRRYDGLDG